MPVSARADAGSQACEIYVLLPLVQHFWRNSKAQTLTWRKNVSLPSIDRFR
jgi:hypothetical protein